MPSKPSNLDEFRNHCLRRLGSPVVDINLDETQVDDAISEALEVFWEEHMDGSREHYLVKEITEEEANTGALNLEGTGIYRVSKVVKSGGAASTGEWHTVPWQITQNAVSGYKSYHSILASDYMILQQRLKTLGGQFGSPLTFRHSKFDNKVHLEFNVSPGEEIVLECFENMDPEKVDSDGNYPFKGVWGDQWLQKYATALIKKRWGQVLVSLQGVTLPGGLQVDGNAIFQQAEDELRNLDEELRKKHQKPLGFLIG